MRMPTKPLREASRDRRDARTGRPANDAGFTLLELLVALGILVLLAAIVGPQVAGYLGRAKTDTARVQLSSVASALELYALDNGGYPTPQAGLRALIEPPTGASRWRGPYLSKPDGLVDPWGRPYLYRVPGKGRPFEIYTLGRDNAPGGTGEDQDITN
jgi:general secretion pathway protein G